MRTPNRATSETDPRDDDVVVLLARWIPRRIHRGRAARTTARPRALRRRWIGRRKPKPSARKAPIAVGRPGRRRIGRSRGGGFAPGKRARAAPSSRAARPPLPRPRRAERPRQEGQPRQARRAEGKIDVPKPVTNLDLNGRRLVAVGDIHGDFAQAMKALELSKCMDSEGKWIGGTTVLSAGWRSSTAATTSSSHHAQVSEAREGGEGGWRGGRGDERQPRDHERHGRFPLRHQRAFGECRRWVEKRRAREAEKLGEENVGSPFRPFPTA